LLRCQAKRRLAETCVAVSASGKNSAGAITRPPRPEGKSVSRLTPREFNVVSSPMNTSAPTHIYRKRIEDLSVVRKRLDKKGDLIAWFRLAAIIAVVASFFYLIPFGLSYAFLAAIIFLGIFLRLVVLAANNKELMSNLDLLLEINHREVSIASGDYTRFPEGREHIPNIHDYAHDLDILGRASIFQYINRTTSQHGGITLSQWLLSPASTAAIVERQQAARELAGQYEWRQQFQAYGMANMINVSTQEKIDAWMREPNRFAAPQWKWIRFVFPAMIISAGFLTIWGPIPSPIFFGLVFIFFVISGLITRKVTPVYIHLDKVVPEITTFSHSIRWIEKQSMTSPLLAGIQQQYSYANTTASAQVKALKEILDRLDFRLNPLLFLPLNTFLFWDLHQVISLEKWKDQNKPRISKWFNALGEMEAVCSIATLTFNHPLWAFPVMRAEEGTFIAEDIGHPLIADSKRVTSSFSTSGKGKIALITGSNMAGKSTFLRAAGVNIVLAMMGAPVCAKSLTLSRMHVTTSMRVNDNLEESTSTFYAELKKLKHIIEAVNRNEKVFLLLDEILRGTNSLDRHTGSTALIRQLVRHNAVGMLATHDLQLAELGSEYPENIHNYHFDVQVSGEELYFDYKLKEGVCKSLNASILMKKIGIEL